MRRHALEADLESDDDDERRTNNNSNADTTHIDNRDKQPQGTYITEKTLDLFLIQSIPAWLAKKRKHSSRKGSSNVRKRQRNATPHVFYSQESMYQEEEVSRTLSPTAHAVGIIVLIWELLY